LLRGLVDGPYQGKRVLIEDGRELADDRALLDEPVGGPRRWASFLWKKKELVYGDGKGAEHWNRWLRAASGRWRGFWCRIDSRKNLSNLEESNFAKTGSLPQD